MRGNVKHEAEMRLLQIYLKLNFGVNICMFMMWLNHQWTFIIQGTNKGGTGVLASEVTLS